MMNEHINKKSLADEVASKIREHISAGRYQLNEKLPTEPALMDSFGVGRSTIREAVKLLANTGLLRVQQGVGTFVKRLTADNESMDQRLNRAKKQDIDEVRQLLEMKIAEKAAHNRTATDLAHIKKHLKNRKKAAEAGLVNECIEADISFHVAVAKASKNDILADLYKSVAAHLKTSLSQRYTDTKVFKDSYQLHEQLLKNITAGDGKKAWDTAEKIIGHSSH